MRGLAARLGVSHSTVSRALRNDARITAAVRERVLAEARKAGYRRDPRLAELMRHMRGTRRGAYQGLLAWMTTLNPADRRQQTMIEEFLAPAERRAEEMGYRIKAFFGVTPGDVPRLERALRSQGIRGAWAFMLSEVDYDDWAWDWSRFAFVHSGHEPRRRIVDVVDAEDRANIRLLFESLAGLGYRRIGVAATLAGEAQSLFELSAGRTRFALERPEHPAFPPCLVPAYDAAGAREIARWIERHGVDCIASRWRGIEGALARLGFRIPKDIGLAYVTVHGDPDAPPAPAGIDVRPGILAATAIETLVASVEQHRYGLPAVPRQIPVPGVWRQGATCRDVTRRMD